MPVCIFCRLPKPLSNEHIFPRWLQEYLEVGGQPLKIWFYWDSPEEQRSLIFNRHLNGHVCRKCNNGWMSQLESAAKPLLCDMLDSKPRFFTNEETAILGLWISKTALTLHDANPYQKSIPERHYQLAYEGKAPTHYMIHVAHLQDRLLAPSWIQDQNWMGLDKHFSNDELPDKLRQTYRVVIGFGHFAARVIYFPLKADLFPLEEGVPRIYPRSPRPLEWPPQHSIDDLWELNNGIVVPPPPQPIDWDLFSDNDGGTTF